MFPTSPPALHRSASIDSGPFPTFYAAKDPIWIAAYYVGSQFGQSSMAIRVTTRATRTVSGVPTRKKSLNR